MMYLWLIVGFGLLIQGANMFVDCSSSVAKLFKISPIIIGLTVVAMGTSAPELAVSLSAALSGSNEIALSNVVGSNIFNLLVVVGCCAVFKTIVPAKDIVKRDLPISIGVSVLVLIFVLGGVLERWAGIILLVLFVSYLAYLIKTASKEKKKISNEPTEEIKVMSPVNSIIFIVLGVAGIILGGNLVVSSATDIALYFGLSQTLVGLTIVAVGTSLPELVTSIVASKKGENELALGNAVGSNLFNLMLILGVSSTISPFKVESQAIFDIGLLIAFSVIIFLYAIFNKKIHRSFGVVMIVLYIIYTAYIIIR